MSLKEEIFSRETLCDLVSGQHRTQQALATFLSRADRNDKPEQIRTPLNPAIHGCQRSL